MTTGDYQKLMDRGWRRCGAYFYKYDFEGSCCQPYTIRLDTTEFKITQSQKKVMKKFNKYLLGEDTKEEDVKMKAPQDPKDTERRLLEAILTQLSNSILNTEHILSAESIKALAQTSIINKPKDKGLINTRSWSSNTLIKLLFKLKEVSIDF